MTSDAAPPDESPHPGSTHEDATNVNLKVEYPDSLSRRLLFVKWLLAIPPLILLSLYGIAVLVTTFISFWAILFTRRYPGGLFDFARGYMALQARTYSYFPLLLTDQYPLADRLDSERAVHYEVEEPERLSRWLLLLKLGSFLLGVVSGLTAFAAFALAIVAIPAWFAILFTGRYPRTMFNFTTAVAQWCARVTTWEFLMRDEWSLFARTSGVGAMVVVGALATVGLGLFNYASWAFIEVSLSPASLSDARDVPCYGERLQECLELEPDLLLVSYDSCDGVGKRVCLVPLGRVSPDLVNHLTSYYRVAYGLEVRVLTPSGIPFALVHPESGQIDASSLVSYMSELEPGPYLDPGVVLIGITPVDLYDSDYDYRFVFGVSSNDPSRRFGVVSAFRMNPVTFGEPPNDTLFYSRVRKLVTKYIGEMYYDLPLSSDSQSPLYNSIMSVRDLDGMDEGLPLGATSGQ